MTTRTASPAVASGAGAASGCARVAIACAAALLLAGCSGPDRPPAASPSARPAATASPSATSATAGDGSGGPVTVFELADPLVAYQGLVTRGLDTVVRQVETLSRDVGAGDLAAARADWLAAHLSYHRLGAAYGAFGDTGKAVDGLARGLPGRTTDPGFTGFHRVELALWSGGGTADAVAPTARLLRDVRTLRAGAATLDIPANQFTVRAHEILEDTLRFQLTDADDYGSGSSLATAEADLEGTRAVVKLLRPVLDSRAPVLGARIDTALDDVDAALTGALRAGGGRWTAVRSLPLAVRQHVDAAVGGAVEALAPVPGLLAVEDEND